MKTNITYSLIKTGVLLAFVSMFPCKWMIPAAIFVTLIYQYVIAIIFGMRVMPSMDVACFYTIDKATVNFMSCTLIEGYEVSKMRATFLKHMKLKYKFRSGIYELMNDYYWKETNPDETIDVCVVKIPKECKTQKDLEEFCQNEINIPLPFNKPQWRLYYQEKYQEKYTLIIWKQHHSLCDGVSCISHHLTHGGSDLLDISSLVPIKHISFMEKFLLRVSVPFQLIKFLVKMASLKQDKHLLHDGKRQLSGKKLCGTSSDLSFHDIRAASKKQKCTINDLVTACMATAMKQYLIMNGDKTTDKINIVIPANIRFGHYKTIKELKFENKFAPVPLVIPLDSDITKSIPKVIKVTSSLRNSFAEIYATYAMSFYTSMLVPYFISDWFIGQSTKPYTMAFSNTPGLLKPLVSDGKKSIMMFTYIIPSGYTGMALGAISYVDFFKITLTVDDAIMKDPQVLINLLEENIKKCYDTETKNGNDSNNSSPSKNED
ncbi:diacylglycerol o-acyltransferase [Stylonychia lemnae]|uniref:Diacylglycerol o-acyltransferase n=1 Tax=Stylonychia lemnae TaxID=5949 RepID=A0A078B9H9_STYLE|nr:diacylglycerol o-acyltransferase [Stylonychia lemnae]|eukprot:CDW90218.1 diacylglycerol o-acyltransferase [Stylonychia lemnae]